MHTQPALSCVLALVVSLVASACGDVPDTDADGPGGATVAAVSDAGRAWVTLFDGTSLDAWRGFAADAIPPGWQIDDDSLLYFDPAPEGGGDLVTREAYADFELELAWKISECGNSGLFYRGVLGDTYDYIWQTAPEMQVLDDACHPDARYPSHRAGSNYDLYVATPGVVKPAGEWNDVRIVARGGAVEHWLNGERVVAYEQGSEAWAARVAASKFRRMPTYGAFMSGVIGLQDHGDPVWFRDIRIRPLDV
ncbi:MAG: DUF1080 domain-containing protein [Bacteroidota bacterium]